MRILFLGQVAIGLMALASSAQAQDYRSVQQPLYPRRTPLYNPQPVPPAPTQPMPQMPMQSEASAAAAQAPQPPSGWVINAGAGALLMPEYEGAQDYDINTLPFIDARYGDSISFNPFRGLRYSALQGEHYRAGIRLGADFGRDEDDADRLQGLGDVDTTLEGLLFASYQWQQIDMDIMFAQDVSGGGHEGYRVTSEVGYTLPYASGLFLRPAISTTYASDDYMQSYFSVNPTQSARSGLGVYEAEAGFKDLSLNMMARYPLTESWSVNGIAQYKRLVGDAADSPIVEDENQLSTGAFFTYQF